MKVAGGVACEETREMTTIQIPSTAARSMTFPMSRMTSTLPETSHERILKGHREESHHHSRTESAEPPKGVVVR